VRQGLTGFLLHAPILNVDLPGAPVVVLPTTTTTTNQQVTNEKEEITLHNETKTVNDSFDEDSDDEGGAFADFFVDENYQIYNFEFQDIQFDIYHLNTSSTQYDLTGQVIWPASEVLAKFLIDKRDELNLKDKKILEFGSGAGLSGFAACYAGCQTTVLTDDSTLPIIERLLKKNVDYVNEQIEQQQHLNLSNTEYEPLRWGTESELEHIKNKYGLFDILIGADTVYWPASVQPLLQSIDILLSYEKGATCYLAYVERATQTCNELINTAQSVYKFKVEYLPDSEVDLKYKTGHLTAEIVKMLVLTRTHDD
jgi:predicted nicotinamide N-methyase